MPRCGKKGKKKQKKKKGLKASGKEKSTRDEKVCKTKKANEVMWSGRGEKRGKNESATDGGGARKKSESAGKGNQGWDLVGQKRKKGGRKGDVCNGRSGTDKGQK